MTSETHARVWTTVVGQRQMQVPQCRSQHDSTHHEDRRDDADAVVVDLLRCLDQGLGGVGVLGCQHGASCQAEAGGDAALPALVLVLLRVLALRRRVVQLVQRWPADVEQHLTLVGQVQPST